MDLKPAYEELEQKIRKLETELRRKKGFEKALRDLEMRFSRIFEQSPVSYTIYSPDGTLLEVNSAWMDLWQTDGDELIGKYNLLKDSQIKRSDTEGNLERAFSGEEIGILEFEYEFKGLKKTLSMKIFPIKDEEGMVQNLVVSNEDITERVEAMKSLKKSEERFLNLVDSLPQVVFETNKEGDITFINRKGLELFGMDAAGLWSSLDMFAERDRKAVAENNQKALKREDIGWIEYTGRMKNGNEFPIAVYVSSVREGKETEGLQGIIIDMTEHKEALEAVRKSEEKYRTILDNIEEGYFETDIKGNLSFFNDSLLTISEYTRQDLMNTNYLDLTEPSMVEKIFKAFNKVYTSSKSERNVDLQLVTKSGLEKHLETSVSVIKEDGRKIGFRGLVRDVSERKRHEEVREGLFKHTVGSLARAAEVYDPDTGDHIVRIGDYGKLLAELMGMDANYQKDFQISAQLHDVGKIHLPSELLNKKGLLTDREFEQIKNHALYGAIIIGRNPDYKMAYDIALFHHEKWNGTGYPDGLRGRAIPLAARITSIVDVFDALVSRRSYKRSFDYDETKSIMTDGDNRLDPNVSFDPELLGLFLDHYESFMNIHKKSILAESDFLSQRVNVLLLEDDRTLQDLIKSYYEDELSFVNFLGFTDIKSMTHYLESNSEYYPQLCLLDVNLPDGLGHDAATMLKEKYPESHLICITADEDIDHTKVHLYGHRVFRKAPLSMDRFFTNIVKNTKIIKEYDLNPMRG
ncbi:MAG: PAS domain S-box protein [Proteobacteria bacterium]|nr:PAS domain S-box protein [Pseudomonadota bacterium]